MVKTIFAGVLFWKLLLWHFGFIRLLKVRGGGGWLWGNWVRGNVDTKGPWSRSNLLQRRYNSPQVAIFCILLSFLWPWGKVNQADFLLLTPTVDGICLRMLFERGEEKRTSDFITSKAGQDYKFSVFDILLFCCYFFQSCDIKHFFIEDYRYYAFRVWAIEVTYNFPRTKFCFCFFKKTLWKN